MTTISSTASTISTATIEAIRSAAEAREALGQAATHQQLDDGRQQVQFYDRAAGRLLVGTGATVAAAVARVRQQHGGPPT
ncbi:MAG: hypothetical protein ABSG86_16115 [Thermoguttaceae bacterium]|jgi:hypothetical protein